MTRQSKRVTPKRGELYLVNFDPTIGSEIKKTRPALIIQNNIANRHSPVTIVAALSSRFDEPTYPTEIIIKTSESGLQKSSVVLTNQLRTIDTQRLVKKLGALAPETMKRINRALEISLGIVDV